MLPQGPLREGVDRLASVDVEVLNGPDITAIAPGLRDPLQMTVDIDALRSVATDEALPLETLRGARVHAVAATGNPERFFSLLRNLGCRPLAHPFPDHHRFRAPDLAFGDDQLIVMTEKDAVKCRAFATGRMLYLQVSAALPQAQSADLLRRVQDCMTRGIRT